MLALCKGKADEGYCSKSSVWPDLIWVGLCNGQHVLESCFYELSVVQPTVFISNNLSQAIFAAFFSLLRVAFPEGALQTPTVHTSNRNTAWILLCKCKPRYNIRVQPLQLPEAFLLTSAWLEGMVSLLFNLSSRRLTHPIRPLNTLLNVHLMLFHTALTLLELPQEELTATCSFRVEPRQVCCCLCSYLALEQRKGKTTTTKHPQSKGLPSVNCTELPYAAADILAEQLLSIILLDSKSKFKICSEDTWKTLSLSSWG